MVKDLPMHEKNTQFALRINVSTCKCMLVGNLPLLVAFIHRYLLVLDLAFILSCSDLS